MPLTEKELDDAKKNADYSRGYNAGRKLAVNSYETRIDELQAEIAGLIGRTQSPRISVYCAALTGLLANTNSGIGEFQAGLIHQKAEWFINKVEEKL